MATQPLSVDLLRYRIRMPRDAEPNILWNLFGARCGIAGAAAALWAYRSPLKVLALISR